MFWAEEVWSDLLIDQLWYPLFEASLAFLFHDPGPSSPCSSSPLPITRLKTDRMYWRTVLTPTSRRRSPPPLPLPHPQSSTNHVNQRPGPTPYPYALANPALTTQFEFPSANSTPNGTPSGSEVDADHEHDGDHEQDHEQVDENGNPVPTKSGRAGNRRRQKYSRTRTGCLSCRTRRIKCDEARPVCKRCIIAKKTVCPVLNEILRFWERELMRLVPLAQCRRGE